MIKKFILDNRFLTSLLGASFILLIAALVASYVKLAAIEEPLILHWSEYTGINQIGSFADLALLVSTGLIMWGVNCALAFTLDSRQALLGKIVALGTLFVSALLFLAFMAIIAVNT
jgi:hypothetical protein